MKKAIGGAYVYNLVIVFMLIMFGFLMASFSYMKAYRVSKGVAKIIENYSGYNSTTQTAIESYLTTIGYSAPSVSKDTCPKKNGVSAEWAATGICFYKAKVVKDENNKEQYITYGVLSYMTIDLPLIELIKIPIYGETEKIYVFK